MGKTQANDEEEREGSARSQASDEGEGRGRRVMGKSRRDTQLRECKRQASDGVETCKRDTQLMGEGE